MAFIHFYNFLLYLTLLFKISGAILEEPLSKYCYIDSQLNFTKGDIKYPSRQIIQILTPSSTLSSRRFITIDGVAAHRSITLCNNTSNNLLDNIPNLKSPSPSQYVLFIPLYLSSQVNLSTVL